MTQTISISEEDRYAELQLIALDYAREGKTNELETMIKYGMNVNLCTHKEDSLLMLASYNGNEETAKMLLDNGASIDRINQRGQTPLEGVCFKGNAKMVRLLLEYGASMEGNAVIYATMFGNKDVLELLKNKGIDSVKHTIWGFKVEWLISITSSIRKLFEAKEVMRVA